MCCYTTQRTPTSTAYVLVVEGIEPQRSLYKLKIGEEIKEVIWFDLTVVLSCEQIVRKLRKKVSLRRVDSNTKVFKEVFSLPTLL